MKSILSTILCLSFLMPVSADEGMWLPMLLKRLNIEDMQKKGLKLTAHIMKKEGANSVRAICTHGVLSGKAYMNIEQSLIEEVIISDTLPTKPTTTKIKILTIADLFSETIKNIDENKSISTQFIT